MIGLYPSDPVAVDVVSIQSQWYHLSTKYALLKERSKTLLTLYCMMSCSASVIKLLKPVDNLMRRPVLHNLMIFLIDLVKLPLQVCYIVHMLASKFIP